MVISRAALDYIHKSFEYIDMDGNVYTFADYMDKSPSKGTFKTMRIEGARQDGQTPLQIEVDGKSLQGEQLENQLSAWTEFGCMEPDVLKSIKAINDRGGIHLSGKHFVLIGAGSAMGPLETLLRHGATVICIDVPGKWGAGATATWKHIIETARNSSGTAIIPVDPEASVTGDEEVATAAGCNLIDQPAEIYNWLSEFADTNQLTIGNYTYLDGELFVKLTVCADAILEKLCSKHPDTAIAFLGTPSDIHLVPKGVIEACRKNYLRHDARGLEKGVNHLSKGKYFVLNELPPTYGDDGRTMNIVDAVSTLQGPNYL